MLNSPAAYIVIILVLDVLIVGILAVLLYRSGRLRKTAPGHELRALQQLEASLKQSIDESSRSSELLLQQFDQRLRNAQQFYTTLAEKEAAITALLDRTEAALKRAHAMPSPGTMGADDAYRKAARLLSGGSSADEVHKACNISRAEIDLIAHIVKATTS
jgi:hypothetical protein